MSSIPEKPAIDGEGRSTIAVRFEDVAQDGRMLVEALATGVNDVLWRAALRGHPLETHAFPKGLLAILTRFVVETGDGPFDVDGSFDAEARFSLAHGVGDDGRVNRLYLNAWVDTFANIGRTNLAPPPNAGERAVVGRTFVEHVFTRPFAAPDQRRVVGFDIPGLPSVPPTRYAATPMDALLGPRPGESPIDAEPTLDELPFVFGLRHTDSNQHVNSLVYPRVFEEACIRRFAKLGRDVSVLARSLDITYRKPCFAGQTVRIALAAFERDGRVGVRGGIYDATDLDRKGLANATPNAVVRMTF